MGVFLLLFSVLVSFVVVPQVVLILVVLNFGGVLFLSFFQIVISFLPKFKPKRKLIKNQPFVSILVPAYNEPPAILMQTLESLSQLQYENFEVLVIDNNTKDISVWKPVEIFTKTLGERFRFFHVDQLSGFKAGAVNYLLKRVDSRSEYIAVIDADYLVKPDFLLIALSYFFKKDIALVQFPQCYRNCSQENQPIADEYSHFFSVYMNMANHFDCVPSTGTLSVYKSEVLKQLKGFRSEILTEDADIGLRIYEAGYKGVYVDLSVGYGLMPYDIEAYRKQKWRWAFGNAQSLPKLFLMFKKNSIQVLVWVFSSSYCLDSLKFFAFCCNVCLCNNYSFFFYSLNQSTQTYYKHSFSLAFGKFVFQANSFLVIF